MTENYRIGTIEQVNDEYTCDVWFDDIEMMMEGLQVLMRGTRNRDLDLPNVGDTVLCLFLPPMMSDGVIIGCVYTEDDPLPDGDIGTWCKVFPDGSLLMYHDGQITIKAKSTVNISAPTINFEGKVIINGTPYLDHKHSAGTYKDGDSKPVSGSSGGVV